MVVDQRASVWKIRLHLVRLSGGSGLINLTPPTTVARNTKTRLRTLMTPTNPLTGLSQVLLCLPWPPAPPVTLPSHPSDGHGMFHSASPCLCIWADTSLIYIVDHFVSLNAKAGSSISMLITFSHRKSKASDYGSSDSTVTFVYVYFNKAFMLFHDNVTFYRFYFVPCAPPMPPSSPSPPLCLSLPPSPSYKRPWRCLFTSRLNGWSVRDVVRMNGQFPLASEHVIHR